jgi:hypothetical protein
MKSLVLFGAIALLLTCMSFTNNQTDIFYGKWKFTATHSDPGYGRGIWIKVPDNLNKYLQFKKNGKLGGNYFAKATYLINDSTYFSVTFTDKRINEYSYIIKKDTLIISQSKPMICDEGCSLKFVRVKE